jgi:hypothetical protein
MKASLKLIVITAVLSQLTACSKTVQWEEEVQLNTGEVIWVKRTVEYTVQGGAGNPFDMAYRATEGGSVSSFDWRGKSFRFDIDVGVVLIAVSPAGYPVVVAEGGYWNLLGKYPCTIPLYVQFVPDGSGAIWSWLPKVEPWLYNMESNRLFVIPTPDQPKRRYTVKERKEANAPALANSRSRQRINPAYSGDLCNSKGK